ncbi:sensor histidine kinase [Geodermatophilus sp. SYSU D00815]
MDAPAADGIAFPGLLPVDGAAFRQRLRLAGLALLSLLGSIGSLLLFLVTTAAIGTTPAVVGGVLLLGLVPLLAVVTRVQRRVTGRVLGHELTARYAPAPRDPVRRLGAWARDSTRWRDYSFLAYDGTGGLAMSAAVVGLTVLPFWYLAAPFVLGGGWWWMWLLAGPAAGLWWLLTPLLVRPRFLAGAHVLGWSPAAELEREVERVTASRAATVDSAAAELRRIERDLHDGVQARIASLGMNLGLAEVLLRRDPDAAEELLAEARLGATTALEDLRSVVRGMHPPVLADRGLAGAVEALALDVAVPVTVSAALPGRAPAPVESAVYFAVAEALANVVKHSGATRAWVRLSHDGGVLRAVVGDDGRGGADPAAGTGLAGVARRVDAFDGTLTVTSPPGGPTSVEVEVPCALSSSRTTPSSGTA